MNRPPKIQPQADTRYLRHPNGALYRYAVEDCPTCERSHRIPQWKDPDPCTATDGQDTRTRFRCRIYISEVPDWRHV